MHLSSLLLLLSVWCVGFFTLLIFIIHQIFPEYIGMLFLGVINILRASFTPGCVHSSIKFSAVTPLLKIASLDEDSVLNYCPLSKLPLQRWEWNCIDATFFPVITSKSKHNLDETFEAEIWHRCNPNNCCVQWFLKYLAQIYWSGDQLWM